MFKGIFKNKMQREFQKQMKEAERELKKKEKKGEGLFTNRLFKLRFYGYAENGSKNHNVLVRIGITLINIAMSVLYFVAGIIAIFVVSVGVFVIIQFLISVKH